MNEKSLSYILESKTYSMTLYNRLNLWCSSRVFLWLALAIVIVGLASCSTDDDRDECCERIRIDFRYSKGAADVFPKYIKNMRHFLFTDDGRFIREIPAATSHLQHLYIPQIEEGAYQLVTLGNADKATVITDLIPGQTRLSDFLLRTQNPQANVVQDDSDPIYWGILSFRAERNKDLRYLCDMSNIHCRLTVTVTWMETQPETDNFILQIREVPSRYRLNPQESTYQYVAGDKTKPETTPDRVVHHFPYVYEEPATLVVHRKEVPRLAGRVKGTFRTLRYTDGRIPYFVLLKADGTAVTKEIHLSEPFALWGWKVSDNIEQEYEIEIYLYDDRMIVHPAANADVLDWVDGGTVG